MVRVTLFSCPSVADSCFFQGRSETCGVEETHPWLNQSNLSCPAGSWGRNKCLLLYATEFGVVFYAAKLWLQLTDTTCWNWGSESLRNLFKDTKLVNGKARILTQVFPTLINTQALSNLRFIFLSLTSACQHAFQIQTLNTVCIEGKV